MPEPCRILVADDHEDVRDLLTQLLEGEFEVEGAADGREAIAAIERARPDLLILDLMMPGIDGFAVLKYLARHPEPFLPVIVRSRLERRDVRLKALKMGAHEFLGTPFDEEELYIRIRSMLALKEARDTAERRARELEVMVAARTRDLRLALEDLQRTDRYKDEFLAMISHELRTPLGFIIAYASSLEDGVAGPISEAQRAMVEAITLGGERLLELVTNLLDMSVVVAGKLELHYREERYAPLVEQAIAPLRPVAAARDIEIATDLAVPGHVTLDEQRTAQALSNLVKNALKFTHEGGKVVIKAFLREGELVTEVSDTGVGIAADDQERLFGPFKQADMSSTREYGGSGLGLSVAKAIVEAQGGHIGVRSAPGVGSTFWFALPEHHDGDGDARGSVK